MGKSSMLSFTSTLDFQEILLYPVCMAVMARKAPKILSKGILYDQEKCSPRACGKKTYSFFPALSSCPLAPEADIVTGSIRQSGKMKA